MQGSEVSFCLNWSGLLEQYGQCVAPVFAVMRAIRLESQCMSCLHVSSTIVYEERFCRVMPASAIRKSKIRRSGFVIPIWYDK